MQKRDQADEKEGVMRLNEPERWSRNPHTIDFVSSMMTISSTVRLREVRCFSYILQGYWSWVSILSSLQSGIKSTIGNQSVYWTYSTSQTSQFADTTTIMRQIHLRRKCQVRSLARNCQSDDISMHPILTLTCFNISYREVFKLFRPVILVVHSQSRGSCFYWTLILNCNHIMKYCLLLQSISWTRARLWTGDELKAPITREKDNW